MAFQIDDLFSTWRKDAAYDHLFKPDMTFANRIDQLKEHFDKKFEATCHNVWGNFDVFKVCIETAGFDEDIKMHILKTIEHKLEELIESSSQVFDNLFKTCISIHILTCTVGKNMPIFLSAIEKIFQDAYNKLDVAEKTAKFEAITFETKPKHKQNSMYKGKTVYNKNAVYNGNAVYKGNTVYKGNAVYKGNNNR